jgi:hypothetical protein
MKYDKRDKAHGKIVPKMNYIYDLIYPIFAPGFCEGIIDIVKENSFVAIFVDSELSKDKISAIIDSDFAEEKQYLIVRVMMKVDEMPPIKFKN